jgi:hypothetical protein
MTVLPPIYFGLVRAGLSNAPRFDALLSISWWCSVPPTWLLEAQCEMVNAISEERREAALLAAVGNVMFDTERVLALQRLLPFYPYPAVAAYVLGRAHEAHDPGRALEAVRVVATASPSIAALYEAHMKAMGPIPTLRAVSLVPRPPLDTLDGAQQAQLCVLARQWYGQDWSAEQMLSQGTENAPLDVNFVTIVSQEEPVLEAWLNEGDEGLIFRVGTTDVVAWMGQGGIPTCEAHGLLTALREALAWSHLGALRKANGSNEGGAWAAYRAARDRSAG